MFEKIRDMFVEELSLDPEEVTMSAELVNDLGINSIDLAEMILMCEEKYGVEIPDEEARTFVTVGDIVNYLSSKTGE
jgi:acyl carrier protein